jgi:hypothetical protein
VRNTLPKTYPKRAFPPGSANISGAEPLVKAPLTVEDWRIVHEAYIAFMTTVRRVAAEAYARKERSDHEPPDPASAGGPSEGEGE